MPATEITFQEWTKLLRMRSARLVTLQELNAPIPIMEKELELIEAALKGCKETIKKNREGGRE